MIDVEYNSFIQHHEREKKEENKYNVINNMCNIGIEERRKREVIDVFKIKECSNIIIFYFTYRIRKNIFKYSPCYSTLNKREKIISIIYR